MNEYVVRKKGGLRKIMQNCLFYLNDLISPPIYSPCDSLSNSRTIRILSNCQPVQFFYSKLLKENKKKYPIPFSTSKKHSPKIYVQKIASNEISCLSFTETGSSIAALEKTSTITELPNSNLNNIEVSYNDFDHIRQKDKPIKPWKKSINNGELKLFIPHSSKFSAYHQECPAIKNSPVSLPFISKHNKHPTLKKGDQISIYHKNQSLGTGTFATQGEQFFIWHDANGNDRFQLKDGLLTIKKRKRPSSDV